MRASALVLVLAAATPALAAVPAGQAHAQDMPAPRPGQAADPSADQADGRPDDQRPAPRPETPPTSKTGVPPAAAAEGAVPVLAPAPAAPSVPPMHSVLRESDFDHSACLLELTMLGADYSEEPPLLDQDQRDCGIDRPILLRRPLPGIEIPGGAAMRCDLARELGHWLRDFVRPAAALLPGQPRLVALEPGSTYQCRATVGTQAESLSQHAFGNAIDIAAFRFDDGSRIAVEPRQDQGDLQEAFQRAVRGAACLHFTTVLGPGSNAAHEDHLHLDIKRRSGGFRLCQ